MRSPASPAILANLVHYTRAMPWQLQGIIPKTLGSTPARLYFRGRANIANEQLAFFQLPGGWGGGLGNLSDPGNFHTG